jgi:hypothetical protein
VQRPGPGGVLLRGEVVGVHGAAHERPVVDEVPAPEPCRPLGVEAGVGAGGVVKTGHPRAPRARHGGVGQPPVREEVERRAARPVVHSHARARRAREVGEERRGGGVPPRHADDVGVGSLLCPRDGEGCTHPGERRGTTEDEEGLEVQLGADARVGGGGGGGGGSVARVRDHADGEASPVPVPRRLEGGVLGGLEEGAELEAGPVRTDDGSEDGRVNRVGGEEGHRAQVPRETKKKRERTSARVDAQKSDGHIPPAVPRTHDAPPSPPAPPSLIPGGPPPAPFGRPSPPPPK